MADLLPIVLAGFASGYEIWIILLVILLLFGSRLPAVARSLGQGIKEFKKGISDDPEEPKAKGGGGKDSGSKGEGNGTSS